MRNRGGAWPGEGASRRGELPGNHSERIGEMQCHAERRSYFWGYSFPPAPLWAESEIPLVDMKIVGAENPKDFHKYRKILVSPTVNTPEPFEGFGGFCGWPKVCKLRNGDLFVAFSAGYWHASWPTPWSQSQGKVYAESMYKTISLGCQLARAGWRAHDVDPKQGQR